mmetsp:Transcript_16059/g.44410  ORF Transcript_16059/g.44410 Transcript_16059/m.44410 type:complete len:129 (+) Transcript_16059:936-1322(+)
MLQGRQQWGEKVVANPVPSDGTTELVVFGTKMHVIESFLRLDRFGGCGVVVDGLVLVFARVADLLSAVTHTKNNNNLLGEGDFRSLQEKRNDHNHDNDRQSISCNSFFVSNQGIVLPCGMLYNVIFYL